MALHVVTMSVVPFAQGPLMPLMKAQLVAGTNVYGPMVLADLMQVPALAARMPQKASAYKNVCVSVKGSDKCNDFAAWTYEYLDDCTFIIDECDNLQKRSNSSSDDYGTDAGDEYSDPEMEIEHASDDDSLNDNFAEPKEGEFKESKEDDFEDSKWADFMDSIEDDLEESKEFTGSKDDEPVDSYEDKFTTSKDDELTSSKGENSKDHKDDGSVGHEDDVTTSEPTFADAHSTLVAEGAMYPPAVIKAFKVARQLSSGIPQSVQDALISDPNAPRSLAEVFSGDDLPDWYNNLPERQRDMFLTGRAAQTGTTTILLTTGGATTMTMVSAEQTITTTTTTPAMRTPFRYRGYNDPSCDNPGNNVTQSCIELAVSSKVADHYSRIATDMSQAAESLSCSALSSAASTVSEDASSASSMASASGSSLGCDGMEDDAGNINEAFAVGNSAASAMVSVPKSSAVFAVSFTVAVVTLSLALYL